jgi:hypothetical protein
MGEAFSKRRVQWDDIATLDDDAAVCLPVRIATLVVVLPLSSPWDHLAGLNPQAH